MAVKIDEINCTGCGICVQVCPVEAITVERVAKINVETCTGCGSCVAECPNEAIFMEGTRTASSSWVNATPSSHISVTRLAPSPTPHRVFNNQSCLQWFNRSGGLLEQIFDFFRKSGGQGGGRGGRRGRGRGKGRRP
ncbi:MAG: 4Fe-4S binding protein [Deltaproteobacteria bacterium]|nr:4Fe-4S binding protein [Deltaproteobacteria bacterium]